MNHVLGLNDKAISPPLTVKLSKTANISTTIVRREATLTDSKRGFLIYALEYEEYYVVRFIDVRIMDIVNEMASSKFLTTNSRVTYVRLFRVGKLMMNHKEKLLLPLNHYRDALGAITLGITQFYKPTLYIFPGENILLMTCAADKFVTKNHEHALVQANVFNWHTRALLEEINL